MQGLSEIVIGAILLGVVLIFPGGILGSLSRLRARVQRAGAAHPHREMKK